VSGRCVALMRAVNVGGHNKVAMAELRELFAALGLRNARTLLQSGNCLFDAGRAAPAALERRLERAARERLGLETTFFVRTATEWSVVVAANPFPAEAARDPGRLLVYFLEEAPAPAAADALAAAIRGRERVHVAGRHAWVVYPDGAGRSKLTSSVVERQLSTRGTARNWNTVLKLAALLAAAS
jgi:uncharacterized protein (DUF1697 family)